MPDPAHRPKVALEDLLRLKRAERPAENFWPQFERQLRAKQLSAIVGHRAWWQGWWSAPSRLVRYSARLGLAASFALAVVAVRDYFPSAPSVIPVAAQVAIPIVSAPLPAPSQPEPPLVAVAAEPVAPVAAPEPPKAPAADSAVSTPPAPTQVSHLGLVATVSPFTGVLPADFAIPTASGFPAPLTMPDLNPASMPVPGQLAVAGPAINPDIYAYSSTIFSPAMVPAPIKPSVGNSDPVALVVDRLSSQDLSVRVSHSMEIASAGDGLGIKYKFW